MLYGVVKKLAYDRGFGFIQPQFGRDVYFHASVVENAQFDRIAPEQPVKYELEKVPKEQRQEGQGPKAKLVVLLDRMPGGVLPPAPQTMAAKHHPRARQRKPTWRRQLGEMSPPDPLPADTTPAASAPAPAAAPPSPDTPPEAGS